MTSIQPVPPDDPRLLGLRHLLAVIDRLRAPDGCPWDREQTEASMAPYLIEEAHEWLEAIEEGTVAQAEAEAGDALLGVLMICRIAQDDGRYDLGAAAEHCAQKLIRRHPHVFNNVKIRNAKQQSTAWESQKANERAIKAKDNNNRQPSALDGVAVALPALMRAEKLQKRAARVGFDWQDTGPVIAKVSEELAEIDAVKDTPGSDNDDLRMECGDLLFSCVNLVRHLGIDAEQALRDSNAKFERRFRRLEFIAESENKQTANLPLEALDQIWKQVKSEE